LRRANTIDVRKPTLLSHKIFGQHTVFCQAKTKRGTRCHNPAVAGSHFCHMHVSHHNGGTEHKVQRPQSVAAAADRNTQRAASRTRVVNPTPNPLLQTLASLMSNSSPATDRQDLPPKNTRTSRASSAAEKSNGDTSPSADDPFEALAAAVSAAAEAAEQSAPNGQPKRGKRHGPPDDPLGKAIYSAAFGIGYGVALPTFLLIGMLPDNALGRGLKDGAKAAKEAVNRRQKR